MSAMKANCKHRILICLGSSCYSRGNAENLAAIKSFITEHGLEADIDFRGHLCNESCNKGPIVQLDDNIYEEVTQSSIHNILVHHFNIVK